jgi:hypothetical protein
VSPVIILGLVLMWAVVLVPMWLRRHDEVEESRSVDRFSAAMHTLSRHEGRPAQRNVRAPQRPAVLDVHVSGASAPEAVAARRRRTLARRRSRLFTGLLLADIGVLVGAVTGGSPLLWTLQVLLDVAAVCFVVHLRRMAVMAAASRRRAVARRRDNAVLDELERGADLEPSFRETPEWEEGVTVFHAGSQARPAAQPVAEDVFDQTALLDEPELAEDLAASFDEAVALASSSSSVAPRMAATDGFFDQETDLSAAIPPRKSFIETGAIPAATRAAEVAERAQRAARAASAAAAAAAEAEAVGGRPWEPRPVPRPTYAMKPAAPQSPPVRPRRSEPLLPPVERAVELETDDDLEAILDRRWAVND